ncbi:hypothetical protein AOQ84DRAFT_305675, partial [Glonium stellatum]
VAYFESGRSNIDPRHLKDVIALSFVDSLYITAQLLCDPYEYPDPHELKRILGNVGKAGITLLVPPSNPMVREVSSGSWRTANYVDFDGKAEDCFSSTSLHLSFTEFHLPLYDGVRGLLDNQVSFLESVVSIHEAGSWVADIDICEALEEVCRLDPQPTCEHAKQLKPEQTLVSVECWDEVLDMPVGVFVARAHKNWIARLALAAVLVQQAERDITVTLCPETVCWPCVAQESLEQKFLWQESSGQVFIY